MAPAIILSFSELARWTFSRMRFFHGNKLNANILKAHHVVAIAYSALFVKNRATTMGAIKRNKQTTNTWYMNCAAGVYLRWLDANDVEKPCGLDLNAIRQTTLGSRKLFVF